MSTTTESPALTKLLAAVDDLRGLEHAGLSVALLTQANFFAMSGIEGAQENPEEAGKLTRYSAVLHGLAVLLPERNEAQRQADLELLRAAYGEPEDTAGRFLGDATENSYDDEQS